MKPRTTWISVGVALTLVLAVMGWVTATLLQMDADRVQTDREAVLEEQTRLSLWRIDSAMAPILSREVAALDAAAQGGELAEPPPGVVLRFALMRDDPDSLQALSHVDEQALSRLAGDLEPQTLFARLDRPHHDEIGSRGEAEGIDLQADGAGLDAAQTAQTPYALKTQALRNEDEWSRRKANVEDNLIAYSTISRSLRDANDDARDKGTNDGQPAGLDETISLGAEGDAGVGEVEAGGSPDGAPRYRSPSTGEAGQVSADTTVIEPVWVGEHLLLLRAVGDQRIEGSWLDWEALPRMLLAEVADLLPHAALIPVPEADPTNTERMLATLPARLDPGATIPPPPTWSPLRASLLTGWLIVLAAFAALIVLVRVSLALSERRATFVSAVTHELRTPLTTFRMYTEMLSEGMVEHKRQRYLDTLRREAVRLSGLVENVLAYSRIESDRPVSQPETLSVGDVIDRVADRLRERCEAAGLSLSLEPTQSQREVVVRVDPGAVEQILFNLVDNAAKYGASSEDPRIRISVEPRAGKVVLHVRDFGPGIPAAEAKKIFEPFTKANADAAGTKPGVGLGLALSRRLARQMGGDLELAPGENGADFVLTLPRAS
jgi:signal transduction histidine kinase